MSIGMNMINNLGKYVDQIMKKETDEKVTSAGPKNDGAIVGCSSKTGYGNGDKNPGM